ncbi:MAG TPA: 4Fe-4S dicluster domain-containing protein, partial [Thermodesulfovibrionia bacterium]|nr:4Fe-4S dicluster domain-containing protein [Thermodesulfovibrionia bacterium]
KGLILSLLIIIPTLFVGRFLCSWICPLGNLNRGVSRFFNRHKMTEDYEINAYRNILRLKYYILTALVVLAILGVLQIGLFDPIALITRSFSLSVYPGLNFWTDAIYIKTPVFYGGILVTIVFLAILFANRFLTRFWCRVLCPLGALLGLFSSKSLFRIRRDVDKCTDCRKCLRYCHGGCDPHQELRVNECMVCMNCISQCPEGALHFGLPAKNSSVHKGLDVNRRRLVETAVFSLALLPMLEISVNAKNAPKYKVIRPPGSIREESFLKRCIKCGKCMRVCPTNVIQPALLEAGFEGLWTPMLINKIGYCEYNCVLCGQVCPTGAIMPLKVEQKIGKPPFKTPVKVGTAFYDQGRCLPWAMHTDCIVCEEVCPTSPKAIWFKTVEIKDREGKIRQLKQPYIDTNLCVGCGICENKCPVRDLSAVRVTSIGETRSHVNQMILKSERGG